jgi:hypothetical protein
MPHIEPFSSVLPPFTEAQVGFWYGALRWWLRSEFVNQFLDTIRRHSRAFHYGAGATSFILRYLSACQFRRPFPLSLHATFSLSSRVGQRLLKRPTLRLSLTPFSASSWRISYSALAWYSLHSFSIDWVHGERWWFTIARELTGPFQYRTAEHGTRTTDLSAFDAR